MEARRLRDRFAAETQLTQPVLVDSRSTLAEVAAEWIAEQKTRVEVGEMSTRTYEICEVGLRLHVLPRLGKRQVRSITPNELVGWIRGMRASGFAPHTVHDYWAALHLVLRHAVRRGVIGGNPADRPTSAERPKPGSSLRRFLSREEMVRLLAAAPDRYRVSIACAMCSGLRLGELLGLTWADVDFTRQVLHVHMQMARDGKRKMLKTAAARREVVMMAPLASELRQLRIVSPFSQETDLKVYAHLFDAERHADEARARLEAEYGSLFTCS